jgi:DNA-binding CsgD family transcriptional regulator/tetratricopeptide (TPR) repeat protein
VELLERETAFEQLYGLFEQVVDGHGRLAVVAGEAGIGKTALVQQFCRSVRDRADVLVGACDSLSTPTPLSPLLDIAPLLGGKLEELLSESAPVQRVFGALLAQLGSGPRPRVLVVEDVHWADDATLDLLRFLARRLSATRTLLIATYRDDEVGPRHPLRIALGDVGSAQIVRLNLPSLSREAVARLAAGRGLDPTELHRRTGGNPFFVSQVLATAPTAGVPLTVRDALLARLARLSAGARAVLEAAALCGPRVDPWLVERVAAAAPDSLDACVEAGLLLTERSQLVFRHELLREAVFDTLPAHRQVALHRLVLAALVDSGVRDDLLARLAHHAEGAADGGTVIEYAAAAARRASQLGAHREAAAQYARALRWADRLQPRERALLLEGRGMECYLVDQAAEAIAARREAAEIWQRLGDRDRQGDNLRWLSRTHWLAGQNAQAEETSQQALHVLEDGSPTLALAWALCNHAQLRFQSADYDVAIDTAERAIALGRELNAPDVLTHAGLTRGQARGVAHGGPGRAEIESILRTSLECGAEDSAGRAFAILASTCVHRLELDRAEAYMQEGLAYVREHDLQVYRHYLLGWRTVLYLQRGQWAEALELAQSVESSGDHSVVNRINALRVIGLVRARRGEPGAWEPLDKALELANKIGELQHVASVRAARAEAAWLAHDSARTAAEARPAFDLAVQKGNPRWAAEPAFWLWRAGELPRACPDLPPPFAREIAGDWASAAELWRQIGCPYHQARALSDSTVVPSLRQALGIAEGLGARPLAAHVVGRLRELGARPASPRPRGVTTAELVGPPALLSLSPRERQVVVLVAQACTNREIADSLVISERTAERHVQNVLNRLGLHSRVQVAAWAVQQGVLAPRPR